MRCVTFVLAVLTLAACGGKIEPEDIATSTGGTADGDTDHRRARRPRPPAPYAIPQREVPPSPAALPLPAAEPLPRDGLCASRDDGPPLDLARASVPCQVVVSATSTSRDIVNGDRGRAEVENGTLFLRCGTATTMLMQAAVRCYVGPGEYELGVADLELGGVRSDRACHVSLERHTGGVHGFVSCPNEPADETSTFANSGAPIGLGAFDLAASP